MSHNISVISFSNRPAINALDSQEYSFVEGVQKPPLFETVEHSLDGKIIKRYLYYLSVAILAFAIGLFCAFKFFGNPEPNTVNESVMDNVNENQLQSKDSVPFCGIYFR